MDLESLGILPAGDRELRGLSLWEPWGSYIRSGRKTIETRFHRTHYRGDLLICATKKPEAPLSGHALCLVHLVDCRPMTPEDEEAAMVPCDPNRFAWVVEDLRPVEPFLVKGAQGLWKVNDEV